MSFELEAPAGKSVRHRGCIVSYVPEKGCGFIKSQGHAVSFNAAALADPVQDASRLKDGAQVSFELVPTPEGYAAAKLRVEQDAAPARAAEICYQVPDNIPLFEGSVGGAFELLSEASDFCVRVSDVSLDAARDRLRALAASIGANALHSVKYTFSEGRRGQTIHHFEGVPCFVGRKSESGTITRAGVPFDLNERAGQYFERMQNAQPLPVKSRLTRLDVVVLGLSLFFFALSRFWGLVSLGIGALFMVVFVFRVLTVLSQGRDKPKAGGPQDNSIFRRRR